MKRIAAVTVLLWSCGTSFAQRPSNPALLIPQTAPELDYVAVPDAVTVPDGVTMGAPAAVAFDSKGHLIMLSRGPQAFLEFDGDGKFIRAFGQGLFTRSHGLRIDNDGNYWATDVSAHTVVKVNPEGQVLLTLGTKGQAGAWDEATQSHHFNEPNDLAFGRNGDIFVVQGHTPGTRGDPRVLKFDK